MLIRPIYSCLLLCVTYFMTKLWIPFKRAKKATPSDAGGGCCCCCFSNCCSCFCCCCGCCYCCCCCRFGWEHATHSADCVCHLFHTSWLHLLSLLLSLSMLLMLLMLLVLPVLVAAAAAAAIGHGGNTIAWIGCARVSRFALATCELILFVIATFRAL